MHFLQSDYWKKIKKDLGNPIVELENFWFQKTKIPYSNFFVGYTPRANLKDINWEKLKEIGEKERCVFISIDPVNLKSERIKLPKHLKTGEPVHLQQTVIIDLTKSEDELLSNMKQKHRYNIKLASKKGIDVKFGRGEKDFNTFLDLYKETGKKYSSRSEKYLKTVWNNLKQENSVIIATANFENTPLVSWMLFLFKDTILYPYGGAIEKYKNYMPGYLLVWEIIKWGKTNGFSKFDLFGINLPREYKDEDFGSLKGYTRFKMGFGGSVITYFDTIELIINPLLYKIFTIFRNFRSTFVFKKP